MPAPDNLASSHDIALWPLLQLSDQLFPTGAFAYSHGLEAYVEQGLVQDRTTCQQLFETLGWHTLGPCDLVFCVHAFRRAATGDLKSLVQLDRLLNAFKIPKRIALRKQQTGQVFLRASLALRPPPLAERFLQAIQQGTTPGHHALRSIDHQQNRPGTACRGGFTGDGTRCHEDAGRPALFVHQSQR